MTFRTAAALLVMVSAPAWAAPPPGLIVLTPAGEASAGLPVMARRQPGEVDQLLAKGFSGRLLRLYALEQEYLRRETGRPPEPAYLLLSDRQGGFPRFGFVLDGVSKPDAGYVDLHRSSSLAGRFGAMDQIFPHELLHVIARQLAGEPRESGANQVHAVGVRTDAVTAFQEGFAEHVQIMCVDDPDADPLTRALRTDPAVRARAEAEVDAYARGVGSRYVLGSPSELRFLIWFSAAEQAMRYDAVKENRFARQPLVPDRLLRRDDKYTAYLYGSVVPGVSADAWKPAGVLLSTEGVVAHLFWKWVTDPGLQGRYRGDDFYARFGAGPADVQPLDNAYLKIFHALRAGRSGDTASFVRSYISEFPDEAVLVQRVVGDALGGQGIPDAPEIWLANRALRTGTSLFDQFRALPRTHTFDANAASVLDWLAVPGVTPATARALLAGAPYRNLADLVAHAGGDRSLRDRILAMDEAMAALRRAADAEESLSLWAIVRSYLIRLAAYVVVAAALGACLVRRFSAVRWWRAILCAAGAALLVFGLAWVVISPPWAPLVAPLVLGGLPSAAWAGLRRRSWLRAAQAAALWLAAALPALVLTASWW